MPGKLITARVLNGVEYRLVGGQGNGTQISLQGRVRILPLYNEPKFKEIKHMLQIRKNGCGYILCTREGREVNPHKGSWPEGFLWEHLSKLKERKSNGS